MMRQLQQQNMFIIAGGPEPPPPPGRPPAELWPPLQFEPPSPPPPPSPPRQPPPPPPPPKPPKGCFNGRGCRELVEVLPTACDDERTRARCMLSCQTCPPPSAPPPSPAPPIEEVNGCYPPECIPRTHTCRDPALIVCSDDCKYAKDVACDDGAQDDGGVSDLLKKDQYCEWGTDCSDCGPRCCEDDMDWLGMWKIAGDSPPLTPSVTTFNPPVSPN